MPHKPAPSVPIRSRREPKRQPRWVPCRTPGCAGFGSHGFQHGATHLCSDCYPLSPEYQAEAHARLAELMGADDDDVE